LKKGSRSHIFDLHHLYGVVSLCPCNEKRFEGWKKMGVRPIMPDGGPEAYHNHQIVLIGAGQKRGEP
jgi:hypothetical protein